MHRVHVNSLDWSRRCPLHGHYSRLPCAWPGCANGLEVDSFLEVDKDFKTSDRETRYDRVEWPAFRNELYYSWETTGWPSPWVNAKSVAANEHRRRRPPPAMPDVIYQYTSAAALQGMVENDELWLTDYAYLNDASELVHGRKTLESALTTLSESGAYSHSDQVFAPWLDKLRNGAPPRICVASFSMDGDSLSQWRAYGGIAIGFDRTRPLVYTGEALLDVVSYNDGEQAERVELFAHHHHFAYIRETDVIRERLGDRFTYLNDLYRTIAFFKHRSFADEREVRLVYVEGPEVFEEMGQKRARKRYRTLGNQLIPYVTTTDLHRDSPLVDLKRPRLPIKEVVVGPHPRAHRLRDGIEDFLRGNGYGDVEVRLSSVPYQPH